MYLRTAQSVAPDLSIRRTCAHLVLLNHMQRGPDLTARLTGEKLG